MKIYLDIETIPGDRPEKAVAPKTLKKPDSIAAYEKDPANIDKDWRKQSLKPMQGRILCVGMAIDGREPFVLSGDEEAIIKEFGEYAGPNVEYVGHNIKGFDLPFLRYRGFKYGVKLHLPYERYDKRAIDTMELWAGTDWKSMVAQKDIEQFLGINRQQRMDGSDVFAYWQNNRHDEIYQYCLEDVSNLREMYRRMI